jgi:pseudouridine-5'-phosphate glycosidase
MGNGAESGMVVANPIPRNRHAVGQDRRRHRTSCRKPATRHQRQGVHPFLLARVCELTGGNSLASNIQLVLNNARLAAARTTVA